VIVTFDSVFPFVMSIATPLAITATFVLAGRNMARTLLILSLVALGTLALDALLFAYAYYAGLYGRMYNETELATLEATRLFLAGIAGLPTLAVWILTLFDAGRARRWVWLVATLLMGLLAYTTGGYGRGTEISYFGWIAYLTLVTRGPVWLNLLFTTLTHATAVVPLAYALRYRRAGARGADGADAEASLAAGSMATVLPPSGPAA